MAQSRRGVIQVLEVQVHPLVMAIPRFIQLWVPLPPLKLTEQSQVIRNSITSISDGNRCNSSSRSGTNMISADGDERIDGNTDGKFSNRSTSSTEHEQGAWWQVDLGSKKNIKQILIYNRTDCCVNARER
jgi:hypothetical protein